jgi:uncharacterized OsmC-like protein
MSATHNGKRISVRLRREEGFRLRASFEGKEATVVADEPPPLGQDMGATGVELLASAVGTCLSQSLLFCLQRARVPVESLETDVEVSVRRNEEGRLRVSGMEVCLSPVIANGEDDGRGGEARMDRCLGIFERFCTVAESVRPAIPIEVRVEMPTGPARPPLAPAPVAG